MFLYFFFFFLILFMIINNEICTSKLWLVIKPSKHGQKYMNKAKKKQKWLQAKSIITKVYMQVVM